MAAGGGEDLMSDEIVINKCCDCATKNKRTEATIYCVDCKDYYCTACVNIHTVVPSMERHKLLDQSDFRLRSGSGSLPSFPTQRCDDHKFEILDMYCQDHEEVACGTCMALNHKSCRNVFSISENISDLSARLKMRKLEKSIQFTITQIEETTIPIEARRKLLWKSLATAVDSVKLFKQELQTLLDDIERDTILELKKQFDRIEKPIAEEIKIAQNQIDSLNRMATQLRSMEGKTVQEFVCIKTFEKSAKKCATEMNEQEIQPVETVSFAADQSIKSFVQKVKVFGKVTCQLSSVPDTRLAVKSRPNTPIDFFDLPSNYEVKNQREIYIKLPDDNTDCSIWGSCMTDGGFLLLADNLNSNLKRLNTTTWTVKDYLSLVSPPNAVCQVCKTEAAVSLDNNTVQFVTLRDQMSATRILTFNHHCEGLAHSNGKLFISNNGNSVYIHDMNGRELKKITKASSINVFRDPIFRSTRHIAVSADASRVFVADMEKGLITLDIQGNHLSTLSGSAERISWCRVVQVSGCYGVCTDESNVFVCGYRSNNVVHIRQCRELVGQIASISKPRSVCFDSQKRRLYVTKSESNDVIVLGLVFDNNDNDDNINWIYEIAVMGIEL